MPPLPTIQTLGKAVVGELDQGPVTGNAPTSIFPLPLLLSAFFVVGFAMNVTADSVISQRSVTVATESFTGLRSSLSLPPAELFRLHAL
jgi:hypothetical protein